MGLPKPHSRGSAGGEREKGDVGGSGEEGRVTETDTQIRPAGRGPGARTPKAVLIMLQKLRIKSSVINSARFPSPH